MKLQRLHILYFIWLAWVAFCCLNSPYSAVALQGYHLRFEGFLSYAVMTSLAYFYWQQYDNPNPMKWYCYAIIALLSLFAWKLSPDQFGLVAMPKVALGGLMSTLAVILFDSYPWLILLTAHFIVLSNTRTSLLAIGMSLLAYLWLKTGLKRVLKPFGYLMVVGTLLVAFSPLHTKAIHLKIDSMGLGARPQWIMQAYDLSKALPLTGFGLDTLSNYLTAPSENYAQADTVCDKVHFLPLDMLLMTGWIGYTLGMGIFALATFTTFKTRSPQNILCYSVIVGWFTFNLINPSGLYATFMAIWAFLGIKEEV